MDIINSRISIELKSSALEESITKEVERNEFTVELDQNEFPEGGRGWLVILGCICCSLMTFGVINSYGAFQTYYETDYFPNVPSMKLSIIGGCQPSIMYFLTPLSLPMIDVFGIRSLITFGSVLILVALFGLSTLKEGQLWKCYLFHAIIFPIGASFLFPAILFSPIEWFKKKRATALGISMSGVSLGGIFWPILIKHMVPKVGFQWSVRTMAFLFIPLSIGAITLTPQRLDEKFVHKPNTISNSRFCKNKLRLLPSAYKVMIKNWITQTTELRYDIMLFSNLLGMFGSYPAIFYQDLFGTLIAPGTVVSEYLLVIYNLFGLPGRIIPGIIGDRIGRFNTLSICLLGAGTAILGIWIPCITVENIAAYGIYVACFGFCIAPLYSLFPACFAQMFGTQGSETRLGFFLFTSTPGPILGCLISGSFIPVDNSDTQKKIDAFRGLTAFCGSIIIASALVLLLVRFSTTRKLIIFI
uniref:MFS transporter n=1 Tax=Cyberlindnera americana TaxID=36016 RepID=A0A5P8N8D7_9ASCO|nr:MFS transporter [Cyberlindnera americana]